MIYFTGVVKKENYKIAKIKQQQIYLIICITLENLMIITKKQKLLKVYCNWRSQCTCNSQFVKLF